MYFYHIMILLSSITKQQQQQQQQQQHVYDYVPTKPLSPSSNDDNIVMDVNPVYGDFTNNTVTNDEDTDLEYEVVDAKTRGVNTNVIKIVKNPAYIC